MPTQIALSFDAVPITCEVQQHYHSIAPCLAGVSTPAEQAQALNLGYSTITHRELIRDHNRLPHWAHRRRNDGKQAPLEVLGDARAVGVEPDELQRAFGQHFCQRLTDARGFVRLGRWKIYIEEGLPRTPVQLSYWEGKLRAEYQEHLLAEYPCKWGKQSTRPIAIAPPLQHAHPFQTKQMALFDPLWLRDPLEPADQKIQRAQKKTSAASQLRLYFGPELVKSA